MSVSVGTIHATLALKDRMTRPLATAAAGLTKFGKAGKILAGVGKIAATAFGAIIAGTVVAVKAASDFESSFAGVIKTVDATDDELRQLAIGFRQLSKEIPLNVNEINRIGEAAGQLGVKTEDILSFTRTMADLGVTTNLTTEAASNALARMANIMDNEAGPGFDRMGAAIVELGNNLATTEAEIVEFGLRIAGAGKIAGLTEAQIFAIGGAMSSIGVRAQAGGTSVQKVLNKMTLSVAEAGEELEVFAMTAGMTTEEFAKLFREDAAEAFMVFVEGLKTQGEQAFNTLEDLSLQNQRVIRSFIGLAQAGDLLRRSMTMGVKGYTENIALVEEAERRYSTFESAIGTLRNIMNDLAITGGQILLPMLKRMIGDFQDTASNANFVSRAVTGMATAFISLLKIINIGYQVYQRTVQVIGFLVLTIKSLAVVMYEGYRAFRIFGVVMGVFANNLAQVDEEMARLEGDFATTWETMVKANTKAREFGNTIADLEMEVRSNAVAARELATAQTLMAGASVQLSADAQLAADGVAKMNQELDDAEGSANNAGTAYGDLTEEVQDMIATLSGANIEKELQTVSEAYDFLVAKGEVTTETMWRMAESLVGIRDAGEPIPAQYNYIIEHFGRYVEQTEAVEAANQRAQASFEQFDLGQTRLEADALIATYFRLTEAGALNTWQTKEMGEAAKQLSERLGESLGPEFDALIAQLEVTTVEKVPSLREAIGQLATGFSKMAQIAGGSFSGIMKAAGETVGKIDLIFTSVETVKTAFKSINDFFVGGGWDQLKNGLRSVIGYLTNTRGATANVSSAVAKLTGNAASAATSIAQVGTGAATTAATATTSFASMASGMAAAAAVALTLWAVISGGPSASQMASQRTKWIEAGGNKAESAKRRALADLQTLQRAKYAPDAIPLQHGGIVTQPTVGLIGEAGAEAVIPLDKFGAMGDEQLLTEMRGLRSELRLLPLHLRDAILLAQ